MEDVTGGYPSVGMMHKNGDQFYGRPLERVRDLWQSGRPPVSTLIRSSVTPLVKTLRIGVVLTVKLDGFQWWASSNEGRVGCLSWNRNAEVRVTWFDYEIRYPTSGRLHVERVLVDKHGVVVNCGGFVIPDESSS